MQHRGGEARQEVVELKQHETTRCGYLYQVTQSESSSLSSKRL